LNIISRRNAGKKVIIVQVFSKVKNFILICSFFIFQRHTREGILVVKDFLYSLDLFLIKFKKLGESHVWNITDSKASFMRVSEQDNYPIIQQRPRKNDNSTFQIFTPIMPGFFSPTLRVFDL